MAIPYIQVAWTLKGHGAGQDNYGFWWLSKIYLYNNNSTNNFFTNIQTYELPFLTLELNTFMITWILRSEKILALKLLTASHSDLSIQSH